MTYDDYLAFEERSDTKHEYLRGEVLAMSGGTPEHAALASSFTIALGTALRGKPCRIFSSDLRVRVAETDLSTYPDLTVVCGRLDIAPDDRHATTNPIVVVEVLSDSSEAYDRGAKFAHYRHLASLREYVLVAQDAPRVEVYRRNESGRFELFEFAAGETVELASIGARVLVDELYANPLDAS
ncbi:MAG: Uma2 family endonuclease [Myxococcota bacterium]|nr:Uma2 family endonuclease [Myxococcota bacterium]